MQKHGTISEQNGTHTSRDNTTPTVLFVVYLYTNNPLGIGMDCRTNIYLQIPSFRCVISDI